jgi:ankyrin repeat protein
MILSATDGKEPGVVPSHLPPASPSSYLSISAAAILAPCSRGRSSSSGDPLVMLLPNLPNELLLCISENLQSEGDINAFSQTNRRLHDVLNTYLYRHNVQRLGSSGLWWAAKNGQEVTAQRFLEEDTDVDAKDTPNNRTPLNWAAEKGHKVVAKLLLDTGKVDADSKNKDGWTPLLLAARGGHEAVVKLLLDTGKVDADSKNEFGLTPLLLAAWNGHEAVVKLLLDTGKVDADSKDRYGRSSLFLATENGHKAVVKLLERK